MTHPDPRNLPEAFNLTRAFLYDQLPRFGERVALRWDGGTQTYRQLADQVDRASAVLRGLGLEQEQRGLLMLPDVPQFASAWLAVVKVGGVACAVNPDQRPEEVAYYLNYTRAKVVFTNPSTAQVIDSVRSDCPHLRAVLVVGGTHGAHLSYEQALAAATPDPSFADTHRDDPAVWLFTSGSTGFPKGAVHRHADFLFNARVFGLPILGYRPEDICLSAPRLAFGYALGTNLLFPLLAGASAVLFPEKPTPERMFQLIARYRPTFLSLVPTVLNAMVSTPAAPEEDFSSLRLAVSAGEALPPELYQRWKRRTGVEVLDGIGSAEMFHIFITNRVGDVRPGSLGKVVEGYQAQIRDDEGQEVPRGEIGTLWIRGDSMAREYWHEREKSQQTFRGEWCVSADKFRQDEDGYFHFCGRGDDMLKVAGKWLSPVEVENALLGHPAVREAAVVGFKDADGLDKPRAFVVLQPGAGDGAELTDALKAHVRATLAPYKAPREIRFLDALPKSDRGKVLKSQLRD